MEAIGAAQTREFEFGVKEFSLIANLAYKRTGIVLNENKIDMVYGRLSRRLRALQLSDFGTYCNLLESRTPQGEEEMAQLVNALTTNLTHFFRESHHFEHLYDWLLEKRQKGFKRLRLWSAACSSGMEPYSMAMVTHHALGSTRGKDVKILATDIDTNMLDTGREGIYKSDAVEAVPGQYRKLYAPYDSEHAIMHKNIKQLVAFKTLNLLDAWPMKGKFDAIFCRNVVIYFDKKTKNKIFDRMRDILEPGGYIYIGHSETMQDVSGFTPLGRTIYQKDG